MVPKIVHARDRNLNNFNHARAPPHSEQNLPPELLAPQCEQKLMTFLGLGLPPKEPDPPDGARTGIGRVKVSSITAVLVRFERRRNTWRRRNGLGGNTGCNRHSVVIAIKLYVSYSWSNSYSTVPIIHYLKVSAKVAALPARRFLYLSNTGWLHPSSSS
jgi:hypothetical protein